MRLNKRSISLIHVLTIVILGTLIYSNSLHGPFQFDDRTYIEKNPAIKNFPDLSQVVKRSGIARIVSYFTFALNYHLHGLNTFGYHLVNLGIHLINGILVWWLLRLMLDSANIIDEKIKANKNSISLCVAALFITHPLQTQAVTYIWQRQAALATLFYLLTIGLYFKARYAQKKRGQAAFFGLAVLSATLAMLTKQIAFTLPLAVLLCEYFFFYTKDNYTFRFKYLLVVLGLALLIIPSFYGFDIKHVLFRSAIEPGANLQGPIDGRTYLLTQFRVLIKYLTLVFVPIGQNIDHHIELSRSLLERRVLGALALLVVLFILGLRLRRRFPLIAFGIFWFFITILVESSVIPIKNVIFEHRMYLPSLGWTLVIVMIFFHLIKNKKVFVSVFSIIIVLLSVLTYQRNKVWQSNEALWLDAVAKAPLNPRAHYNLGLTYMRKANFERALHYYDKALALKPDYFFPLNNRANIYISMGKRDLALNDLNNAIASHPEHYFLYSTRGAIFQKMMEYDRAIDDFTQAIELKDDLVGAYVNRGACYGQKGLTNLALADFNKALEIDPDFSETYNNRGAVYFRSKKHDLALRDFDKAIALDKDYIDAYFNRAATYLETGKYKKSISDFTFILKREPANLKALFNRGKAYQLLEEHELALADLNKLQTLKPGIPAVLKLRSFIHTLEKDFQAALADYNRIIADDPKLAQAYVERGKLYYRMKQYQKAVADFDLAEVLEPQNGEIYFLRALVEYELKEYEKAVTDLRRAKDMGIEIDEFYFKEFQKALNPS